MQRTLARYVLVYGRLLGNLTGNFFVAEFDYGGVVADDEDDAPRSESAQEFPEASARLRVEMVRDFVKDEDAWSADDGAGNREALHLPARQGLSPESDARVESVQEPSDHLF